MPENPRASAPARATCHCGYEIEWRTYPTLPFPEVASEQQLAKREKGGRWVHVMHSGTDTSNEWCPPQRAYPKPVEVLDGSR